MNHGEKTKIGIIEAKARGVDWGKHGQVLAAKNKHEAQVFAESLRPLILELRLDGCRGPKAISEELNKRGIPTRTGRKWRRETVHRLIQRLEPSLSKEVKEARMEGSKKALKLMEQFRQNSPQIGHE